MLEILALWNLCKKNTADEVAHGRAPGMAYLYTILLWFVFEGIGMVAGAAIFRMIGWQMKVIPIWIIAFAVALVFSILITRAIARRGTENTK